MPARLLCLSSTFATDRILFFSSFPAGLREIADLSVWSYAQRDPRFPASHPVGRCFEPFPPGGVLPFTITFARHFDDYAWDHVGLSRSRTTQWRLRRRHRVPVRQRLLHQAARVLPAFNRHRAFESRLEAAMVSRAGQSSLVSYLRRIGPAAVLAMNPWAPAQMEIAAAARALSIPIVAFITSWDNPTTKGRLVLTYDAYIVWSESMRNELLQFYPGAARRPIFVTGAAQYDLFHVPAFARTREQWCRTLDLDPARPVVVYSLGSPNFINEDHGALTFLDELSTWPALAGVQVVVRAHPGFHERGYTTLRAVRDRFPHVRIQGSLSDDKAVAFQMEDQIVDWVNTVRHADVVVNLASSMTVDASLCDTPVVNLDFDPEPGAPNQRLVEEINHTWNHFSPIAHSGGLWLARTMHEAVAGVAQYLSTPQLHREGRKRIVDLVAGRFDGRAGARMASAMGDMLGTRSETPAQHALMA